MKCPECGSKKVEIEEGNALCLKCDHEWDVEDESDSDLDDPYNTGDPKGGHPYQYPEADG